MIFAAKRLKLDDGEVQAWTPLPQAREWPAFDRMIQTGALIDVPDEILSQSIKRQGKARSKK